MHEKILKAGFIAECDETGVRVWMGSPKAMDRLIEAAVLAEREACAKVCIEEAERHEEQAQYEDTADYANRCLVYGKHIRTCAAAIRARNDA